MISLALDIYGLFKMVFDCLWVVVDVFEVVVEFFEVVLGVVGGCRSFLLLVTTTSLHLWDTLFKEETVQLDN